MLKLVDTHTHLYLSQFDADRETVVRNARAAGVRQMLMPNIDSHTAGPMLSVARQFPGICLPMMGLHPTSVKATWRSELDHIESWLGKGGFVAIGETGMDLYWDTSFAPAQAESLERHIGWALKFGLPLVLHSRNALNEIFDILQACRGQGLKGVFHCFPGDASQAAKAIDMGFLLGVGGVLTYKNSQMAGVAKYAALSDMVLETDAPFLAPEPHRGKRNESAFLLAIAQRLAEIKGMDVDEVAATTTRNAVKLFALNQKVPKTETP